MKRYTSRATKLLAIATLICGAVVLIGIIDLFHFTFGVLPNLSQ